MSKIFEEILMDVRVGNDSEVNCNNMVTIQENGEKNRSQRPEEVPKVSQFVAHICQVQVDYR